MFNEENDDRLSILDLMCAANANMLECSKHISAEDALRQYIPQKKRTKLLRAL